MLKINVFRRLALSTMLFALVSTIQAATSIAQYGITWTFNADYPTGQYANGDYYVVAPSGLRIINILPGSTVLSGRVMSGTMVNPSANSVAAQGWDTLSGGYKDSLNAGRPGGNALSSSNPLVVAAGSSVVTQISMLTPTQGWGNRPMTSDAAVLTIVAAAPPTGSFRPPYCGTNKTHYWNKSSLDYGVLRNYAPVAGTPTLATTAAYNARPWMEVVTNWESRQSHPTNNQPEYGRDMAYQTGDALLRLMISDTNSNKETAYINLVQYGIDIYGAAVSGGVWGADGGHCMGRKAVLLLAGKALNDPNILAYADKAQHNIFQEDMQVVVVDSSVEAAIPYTADGNVRSSFAPQSAAVTISNGSPAIVTWPITSATVTISNGSPAVITWPNHGLQNARAVQFSSTGTLPAGISAGVTYWVQPANLTANTFSIASSINAAVFGRSLISTSSAGSGTLTANIGHGFKRQMPIKFATSGSLPAPLVAGTEYWIRDPGNSLNTFQITSAASNDDSGDKAAINTTTAGNGTHSASFALTGKIIWSVKGAYQSNQWAGSNFDTAYHGINMSSQIPHALAALLMVGGKAAWNHDNYFTMIDRDVAVSSYSTTPINFAGNMWKAYRGATPPPPAVTPPVVTPPTGVTPPTHAVININPVSVTTPQTNGSPAFVAVDSQGAATTSTASVSINVVSGMNVGDRVVIVYSAEGGDAVNSVTDSAGNTYSLVKAQAAYNDATLLTNIYSAHVANALTPGAKITVNLNATHYSTKSWFVAKLTGCASFGQPNQTAGNSEYATAVNATAAPTSSPTVLFGVVRARTTETYSGSSWTALGSQDSGASRFWFLTKAAANTSSQNIGGTLSGNQIYTASWVGFN